MCLKTCESSAEQVCQFGSVPVELRRGASVPLVLRSRYVPVVGAPLEVLEDRSPEGMQPVAEILFYLSCPTSLANRTTLYLHLPTPGVRSMNQGGGEVASAQLG